MDDDARTMSRDGSYLAEKTARKIEFSVRDESSVSGIVSFRPLAEEKVKSIMKILMETFPDDSPHVAGRCTPDGACFRRVFFFFLD